MNRARVHSSQLVLAMALSLCLASCAEKWGSMSARRTCLVLSAGGPAGLAHLGAFKAIQESGVRIDCVSGTSMGALIGGLYARKPQNDIREEYRAFVDAYSRETQKVTLRNALIGGVVGGVLGALVTGGEPLTIAGAASTGASLAAGTTEKMTLDRFTEVLAGFTANAQIETLALPYVTFFQQRVENSMRIVPVNSGSLARAIGKSVANPFIFPGFDPVGEGFVDPGSDRLASTPIEDTCRNFPDARLLAINVSGHPSAHTKEMKCPVLEVTIETGSVSVQAMQGHGLSFEKVYQMGYDQTIRVLRGHKVKRSP